MRKIMNIIKNRLAFIAKVDEDFYEQEYKYFAIFLTAFLVGIFTCIFNLWSLPAIAEEWKSAVLISGLLYGSGTSCCCLWESAGGTSKCNRRHKRSVKKKKSRKQKKA